MDISRWSSAAAYYAAKRIPPDHRGKDHAPRQGRGNGAPPVLGGHEKKTRSGKPDDGA